MIERSRVRVPAGEAGEVSSLGSTFCAFISVSVPPPCYRSSTEEIRFFLPKTQVAGYTQTHMDLTYVASNKVTQ